MDEIQKVLIKQGRKDLAQEYYEKVAGDNSTFKCPECGTKVLENTGYCLKCKKKVEKAAEKKSAFEITAARHNISTFKIFMDLSNKQIPDIRNEDGKKVIEALVKKFVDSFATELKTGMDEIDQKMKTGDK